LPHPRVYNLINSLISWVHLFIESDLSDTDNRLKILLRLIKIIRSK